CADSGVLDHAFLIGSLLGDLAFLSRRLDGRIAGYAGYGSDQRNPPVAGLRLIPAHEPPRARVPPLEGSHVASDGMALGDSKAGRRPQILAQFRLEMLALLQIMSVKGVFQADDEAGSLRQSIRRCRWNRSRAIDGLALRFAGTRPVLRP